MYLISFVRTCPINRRLCLLEDISPKTPPSHEEKEGGKARGRFEGKGSILKLSHRESWNSNAHYSDELELSTDYGLDFVNAVLLWKRKVRSNIWCHRVYPPLSVGGTSRDPQWTLKLGTVRNPACSTEDSHWRCGCILRHKGRSLCTTACFFNPTLHLKSVFFHQKFSRIVIVVAVKRFLLC